MSSTQKDVKMENDLGEIRPCDCGGANLTIGPMTWHLARQELVELRDLVAAGLAFEKGPRRGGKSGATPRSVH